MSAEQHADSQGFPDSISADLSAALTAVAYPANLDALLDAARAAAAAPEVLATLAGLPDTDYASADAVVAALGSSGRSGTR